MKIFLRTLGLFHVVSAVTEVDCPTFDPAGTSDFSFANLTDAATAIIGDGIFDSTEFTDFIGPEASGYYAGWCNGDTDGQNLAIGYVCKDESGSASSSDCVCGAVYLGTPCASCDVCDSAASPEPANFEADCSNVNNGECKIDCGEAVNDIMSGVNIVTNTADVCPLSASPTPSAPTPTMQTPTTPSPVTSGAAKNIFVRRIFLVNSFFFYVW